MVNSAKRDNFIHIYFKVWCPERYICKFSVCTISAMMINIEMVTFTQSVSGLRSSLKFFFCTGQMFRRTEQALERPWRCPRLRHRAGRGSRWEEPPRSDGRWRAPSLRSAWPVGWSTRTRRRGCWTGGEFRIWLNWRKCVKTTWRGDPRGLRGVQPKVQQERDKSTVWSGWSKI